MSLNYQGFDINDASTQRPWGAREEQAWKDVIDTVVGSSIQGAKDTAGIKYSKLYDENLNTSVSCGSTGINLPEDTPLIFNARGDANIISSSNNTLDITGHSGVRLMNLNGGGVGGVLRVDTNSLLHDGPIISNGDYVNIPGGVIFSGIAVNDSEGGTDTIDTTKFSGISWRPPVAANTDLTITLTGGVEGQFFTCYNYEQCGHNLVVEGVILAGTCGLSTAILQYDNGGWQLMGSNQ
jgi:hypothetical protein